jgi:hypothetical protein
VASSERRDRQPHGPDQAASMRPKPPHQPRGPNHRQPGRSPGSRAAQARWLFARTEQASSQRPRALPSSRRQAGCSRKPPPRVRAVPRKRSAARPRPPRCRRPLRAPIPGRAWAAPDR